MKTTEEILHVSCRELIFLRDGLQELLKMDTHNEIYRNKIYYDEMWDLRIKLEKMISKSTRRKHENQKT